MGRRTVSETRAGVNRRQLREQIELFRNNLIDCEVRVDDARRELDAAVNRLHEAVRSRDSVAAHLANLIAWSIPNAA